MVTAQRKVAMVLSLEKCGVVLHLCGIDSFKHTWKRRFQVCVGMIIPCKLGIG